jgi:hypothetical protein
VVGRHRPPGRGDRGLGQVQVHVGDLVLRTEGGQLANRGRARGHGLVHPPREREHLHPPGPRGGALGALGQQAGRPVQRFGRRGQRTLLERPGTRGGQQLTGAGTRAGLDRELGGHTRP